MHSLKLWEVDGWYVALDIPAQELLTIRVPPQTCRRQQIEYRVNHLTVPENNCVKNGYNGKRV